MADVKIFDSIHSFQQYLKTMPTNKVFAGKQCNSHQEGESHFRGTSSYQEAEALLLGGWKDMSEELNQNLSVACSNIQPVKQYANVLSVAGYQPVVPLYLSGIPNNMLDRRMVQKKQKVIELTKSLCYTHCIETNTIVKNSVKALSIVKKLEAQGYRIKLNIAFGLSEDYYNDNNAGHEMYCKVCIKQPNERLNVSKLAFPMVHPSMLRRIMLRYIEVNPDTMPAIVSVYGFPVKDMKLKQVFPKDIILPGIIKKNISEINTVDDLCKII